MYCRNRTSYENFKLKLCTRAQSHALGTRAKFQLGIPTINVVSGIVYFREIIWRAHETLVKQPPEISGRVYSQIDAARTPRVAFCVIKVISFIFRCVLGTVRIKFKSHARKHFPRYWPFVRGIPRSPVNSPHKGQWRGALMFYLVCVLTNGWVNNRDVGDLRRQRGHYDVM